MLDATLLTFATLVSLPAGQPELELVAPPQGYFMLNDDSGPHPIPDWAFASPLLDGVSLRGGWAQIEPKDGTFTWFFDQDIERARKAGKKVLLRVYSSFRGKRMAEWVYQAGAQRFEYADKGEQVTMPIPWDKVFLKKWTELIQAMGTRYDGDSTVLLVHMGGLGYTGAEMHLPKTPADKVNWLRHGYSKEKLVAAWKTVIDAYGSAFPHKRLSLNVAIPVANDGVVEEVMGYAGKKLGKRFCVQHNALAARTVEDGLPHQWVVAAARKKWTIGFQQLCPVTPIGAFNLDGRRYGGTLEQSLQIGLRAGMAYLEIYKPDVENRDHRKILELYAKKMKSRTRQTK